jgi:hypothetical protein
MKKKMLETGQEISKQTLSGLDLVIANHAYCQHPHERHHCPYHHGHACLGLDLNCIFEEILHILAPRLGDQVRLRFEPHPGPLGVNVPVKPLAQALYGFVRASLNVCTPLFVNPNDKRKTSLKTGRENGHAYLELTVEGQLLDLDHILHNRVTKIHELGSPYVEFWSVMVFVKSQRGEFSAREKADEPPGMCARVSFPLSAEMHA